MVDPNTRTQKRTPVTLKIKFKSETLEQFIERYAVDVSQGGIFIRTKEPLAVGTQMKFEFQLRDASPLISGEGTVVWTRENDPSRPAIAPGMGVRFDRLGDGSQHILERILAEKAKQAPVRPQGDASRPPLFTDAPTRVAPAPVTEALLGDRSRRNSDQFGEQHTPLPKPMPFHSDADEFPDEAFEEATKVRALDELVAQTAMGGSGNPSDELAARRNNPNPRMDATMPDPNPQAHMAAADEAPGLPNPPETVRETASGRIPKLLDTTPSPRNEPTSGLAGDQSPAKTRLGLEPARATGPTPALRDTPVSTPPALRDTPVAAKALPARPSSPPANMPKPAVPLAPEPERVVARKPSIAPIIIGILVGVAVVGAAVWFFVLKENDDTGTKKTPIADKSGSGSAGSGSAATLDGSGSSGSATQMAHDGSGSAGSGSTGIADVGSGSAGSGSAGSAAPPPAATAVDTIIAASVDKAKVEIIGSDQKGPVPFTAKLDKDKPYKARISAPGYIAQEVSVTGGADKQVIKLVAKPRTITVNSDPAGAQIYIDNTFVKATPADIQLTAAQNAKPKVRVSLRKAGYHGYDEVVDTSKYVEDDDKMTYKVDSKLTKAPVIVEHPNPPPHDGSNGGSGSGAGSSEPTNGNGSGDNAGSATTPTPTPTPTPPSGSATPSGEPQPEWKDKDKDKAP